jgi:hypothetical protein
MSEPRFEDVLQELRGAAPMAPGGLREKVRALPEPSARAIRLRPALAIAAGLAIAVGMGAAAIGGLTGSGSRPRESLASESLKADARRLAIPTPTAGAATLAPKRPYLNCANPCGSFSPGFAPISPGARLQDYRAILRLRVKDLSETTKSAVRTTRHLGGYVASADYTTEGNSLLDLRVPVQQAPKAIAGLTELGTILVQRIRTTDLQSNLNVLERQITAQRRTLELLQAKPVLTADEQRRLAVAKQNLRRLSRGKTSLVRQGSYAKIQLSLTTRKPAAKHLAPGRFDRFWSNASDILAKEAIIVLYALVVAGPFLLLALLALIAERMRRRRADTRLLQEAG